MIDIGIGRLMCIHILRVFFPANLNSWALHPSPPQTTDMSFPIGFEGLNKFLLNCKCIINRIIWDPSNL